MDGAAPTGLRERRRLATYDEIHRAALELFEEQGVRETTVPQIADRARVSTRTFFRYFAAKEQAALPGHRRLLRAIESLALPDAGLPGALEGVEAMLEAVMDSDPDLDEHQRVARLLAQDEQLRGFAAAQERVLTTRLRARLAEELAAADATSVAMLAEVAMVVWRTSWERWGELAQAGTAVPPVALYRQCRAELRRVVGQARGDDLS